MMTNLLHGAHVANKLFSTIARLRLLLVMFLTLTVSANVWGATYKLTKVTSVSTGEKYVFEQGGYVMNNAVSSSALQCVNSYKTTGLAGTESYVWTLESATGGFYMRNVSITTNNKYLNNSSSTSVSFGTATSIWTFTFDNSGIVLIQNTKNNNRFLGWTSSSSHAYKAYATSNLTSYPHAITVYKLEEEAPSCTNKITIKKGTPSNGSFSISKTGTYETCDAPLVITLSNITPSAGYQFGAITQTGIGTGVTIDQANKTVTYAQNTSGTSTINVTFEQKQSATITLSEAGVETGVTGKYIGDSYTLPSTTSQSCGDLEFVGWCTEIIENSATKPTAATYFEPGASVTLKAEQTFYAVFAEEGGDSEKQSILGGEWSSIPQGWTYNDNGMYSGNGKKFDSTSDYVQTIDISSYKYKNIIVEINAGYNSGSGTGTSGSILKISALGGDFNELCAQEIMPTDSYTQQKTLYTIDLNASAIIAYVKVQMITRTTNLGMKYCELFVTTKRFVNYTTQCTTQPTVYLIPKCGDDGGGTWLVVIEWFATF